jgi:hypothetical protein
MYRRYSTQALFGLAILGMPGAAATDAGAGSAGKEPLYYLDDGRRLLFASEFESHYWRIRTVARAWILNSLGRNTCASV